MKTKVGLSHEPIRRLPWLVYWWGDPDPESGKQRKYTRSFRYKRDAREFQATKQAELDRGAPRDTPREVSLTRLIDEFVDARVANLSYKSKEAYRNTLDQVREHFGDHLLVRRIDRRAAETFMATRKRRDGRPGPLSTWSKAKILTQCRAMFAAAVDWTYIVNSPFARPTNRAQTPLTIKPKSGPWHHLIPTEFERLLSVVPNTKRRAAFWLMYGCGLRPGEVYNMTLDRVDLKNRRVRVANRAATEDTPPFTVKSEGQTSEAKERSIPIPEQALLDITAACQDAFKSGGYIVLTPNRFSMIQAQWKMCREGTPWGGRAYHRPWQNRDMMNNLLRDTKAYLRKARVDLTAPFTLTTFRKSYAQNHADVATPPRTLARLLGHSDVRTTMEFYNRVTDANERSAAEAMDRLLGRPKRTAAEVS